MLTPLRTLSTPGEDVLTPLRTLSSPGGDVLTPLLPLFQVARVQQ